jgi:hypothetical protein
VQEIARWWLRTQDQVGSPFFHKRKEEAGSSEEKKARSCWTYLPVGRPSTPIALLLRPVVVFELGTERVAAVSA